MTDSTGGNRAAEFEETIELSRSEQLAKAKERAERILALALNYDLVDLLARIVLWPLLTVPTTTRSRNDQIGDEPAVEYIACWLLSHASRWAGTTNPTITAIVLQEILVNGEQQIHNWWPERRRVAKTAPEAGDTAETAITRARENLDLLAEHELMRSIVVRFPIDPVLWRQYTELIYSPLEDELRESLGFCRETIVALTNVLRERVQKHMDNNLDSARGFHKRARAAIKRLRRGRLLHKGIATSEADLLNALAKLSARERRAAIYWNATLQLLDGAASVVSITHDDDDIVHAVGAEPTRDLLEALSLDPGSLDPAHYELPNPSPEVQYRPFIQLAGRTLVADPIMLDYYADNLIWTAAKGKTVAAKIESRRARFTELKTAECLRAVFGASAVMENIRLYEADGRTQFGEFDVLVDSSAALIVVECKSGRWSRSAQRGSVDRIRNEMEELYYRPLFQLGDRITRLRETPGCTLHDQHGKRVDIDWNSRRSCIGLIMHLDPIDSLQANPSAVPGSQLDATVDALLLCGLPYFEIACRTLVSPGLLLDYLLQRGRLSADKRASAADENEWLAFYLADGLRMRTMSEQGATLGYVSADSVSLDRFVRSGFDPALRPATSLLAGIAPVVESIGDHLLQFNAVCVLMEQSRDNNARLAIWIARHGRVDPKQPYRSMIYILYSADGRRAIALFHIADDWRATRSGGHIERCRELLRGKATCESCTFVITEPSFGVLRARDVFELQLG